MRKILKSAKERTLFTTDTYIKTGQTGYLCNGNDLNALYETLLKILKNNHYKELGINALKFSKNFNWSKIVKKYIELI